MTSLVTRRRPEQLEGRAHPTVNPPVRQPMWTLGLLLVLSTLLPTCQPIGPGRPPLAPPTATGRAARPAQSAAADRAWEAVTRALQQPDRNARAAALEQFVSDHPGDPRAPQAALQLAALRLEQGDADGARRLAEAVAEGPQELQPRARLLLARAHRNLGDHEACARFAGEVRLLAERDEERRQGLLLAADCLAAQGQAGAALSALSSAHELGPDETTRAYLHLRARELTFGRLGPSEAASLRGRIPGDLADHYLRLRAALEAAGRGDEVAATAALRALRPWFAAQQQEGSLLGLQVILGGTARAAGPGTVAALLPLTGPSRRVGAAVLEALLVAAGATGDEERGARLELLDTGGNPDKVVAHLEALAARNDVVGAVGPFEARLAAVAAQHARRLSFPLLPVTVEGAVPTAAGPVFRAFSSNRLEAEALAEHAVATLGARRLAILRPEHAYGRTLSELIRDAWVRRGGEVVGEVRYPAGTVQVEPVLRELQRLPEFEVLFIPDTHAQVGLLAPHLAAHGWWSVAWGQEPPKVKRKRLRPVLLLGTSAWYDARLLTRAGRYLNGALVATGFHSGSSNERVKDFVDKLRVAAGRAPTALDAYARDAFRLLADAAEQPRPLTRSQIGSWLGRPEAGANRVTALTHFDAQGEPASLPFVVIISSGAFRDLP